MVVAWDVDDVLNDLTQQWMDWVGLSPAKLDGPLQGPGDYAINSGWLEDEYLESLDRFRMEKYAALEPRTQLQEWLKENQRAHVVHVAITRTPLRAAAPVSDWVMRNFGAWIHAFIVCPSARVDDDADLIRRTKAEWLQLFQGEGTLIDDTPENLEKLPPGWVPLLFPAPWNIAHGERIETVTESVENSIRRNLTMEIKSEHGS